MSTVLSIMFLMTVPAVSGVIGGVWLVGALIYESVALRASVRMHCDKAEEHGSDR